MRCFDYNVSDAERLQLGFVEINREYVSNAIKGDKFHTKFAWSPKLPLKSKSTNWLIWVKMKNYD